MKKFKDTDWSFVGLMITAFVFISAIIGYAAYSNEKENQKSAEEKLRTEEFTYKGHQYIKFIGHDLFGSSSVVQMFFSFLLFINTIFTIFVSQMGSVPVTM